MFYTLLLTIFYGAILSESGDCQNGGQQVLILRLKDVTKGVCSSAITSTGLENPDNPEANCYSIVGKLNKDEFKNPDGTYELYLTYGGTQGGHNPQDPIQLRWVQSTWITEKFNSPGQLQYAPGFKVINFNPPDVSSGDDKFYGLGKSDLDKTHCYLDGTSGGGDWFNCVGVVAKWGSPGIASYNRGSSKSEALYACRADPCAGVTCPDEEMCVDGKCQRDCGWLDIDGFLNDCSAEFKGQNGKLGTINTKLVDLEQQIKANDGDIQTNKDGINTNAGGISTNGQAIAQLRTDVTGNDQDIAKLRTDVDSNDGDITDLQSKLSAQQTKIDDQQTKIDAQQTKIDAQQVKIDAQQIKIGEQDTKIAKLEAAVQKNEKKLRRKSGSAAMMDFDGDLDDEYHRKYYDDSMNKPYYGWSWESMSWQDIAIIVVIILLMLNLIIMAYRNCCGKKQKKKPYRRVRYMDSEDVDSEANLK